MLDGVDHFVDDPLGLLVPYLQLRLEPSEIDEDFLVKDLGEVVKGDVLVVLLRPVDKALLALVVEDDLTLVGSVSNFLDVFGIEIGYLLLDLLSLLGGNLDGLLFDADLFLNQLELLLEFGDLIYRDLPSGIHFGGSSLLPY